MASSNVSLVENSGTFEGTVTRGVENPFDGKKIVREGTYVLPLARTLDEIVSLSGNTEEDAVFWFNFGRKVAARSQVNAQLQGFDSGDESINDLYKSFQNAMGAMTSDGMSDDRRKKIMDFILGEEKFEPLRDSLKNWSPEKISVDFSKVELKQPSGKKGRPAANAENE